MSPQSQKVNLIPKMVDDSHRSVQIAFMDDPQRQHVTDRGSVPLIFRASNGSKLRVGGGSNTEKRKYEGKKSFCL